MITRTEASQLAALLAAVSRPRTRDEEALIAYWLRRLEH